MSSARRRSGVARATGLFFAWVVLSGGAAVDLLPGIVAALAATALSLALFPPRSGRLRLVQLGEYAVRFLGQSITAGIDVARRALDPRLPVNPGYVRYPLLLPPGPARNTFTTLTSLLPGTVPIGPDMHGALLIHCLDVTQPVAAQLAAEEALLLRIIDKSPGNG
jgi:multicomponent Na+:H+ antiporter subunit E